jgi:uncharacterized protein (TIGR02099 family)
MKRLARALEVLAWGTFFLFAALVLALRFWVLPDIERYREHIVGAMSRSLGLPVRVGALEAGWLGVRPQIALTDVRIFDAQGREALVLPSIENVVSWRSLLRGELRLHSVVIQGPRLTVRRDSAGELYIAGLHIRKGGGGAGFGAWLAAQDEIAIHGAEIEWRDDLRGAPPLLFSALDFRLVNSGGSHALGFTARTPSELGSTIEARAQLPGLESLDGRIFVQLGNTDLAAWRAWVDYPFNVREGRGALRVWATLESGTVKDATADVALAGVRAILSDELAPLALASVQGRVRGRQLADGMEFSGRGLSVAMERGPEIPRTDFEIVWRPQAGGALAASAIDLASIRSLIGALPLPPQLAQALEDSAPQGRLSDARLEWEGPFDAPARGLVRMRFADLALRATGRIPGFSGLSGSIDATHERGKLSLSSRKAAVELAGVFAQPHVAFDSLAGELEWERAGGALALRVGSLTFTNAHASGNVYGSYVHRSGEGPGVIDLSGVLNRADGAQVARYLPLILNDALRGWVASSVLAGEASDVRVRIRGDLRQFPFVNPASGLFQITARVEKGMLEYASAWPRIEDIVGELNFERDRMEIVGRSASILGAQVSNVRVSIPSLRAGERHVLVSGQADGQSADFLRFLRASPLRDTTAFATEMKALGRGKLRLKLDLPLADLAKTRVGGEYDFAANDVTVLPWLPPVEAAAGRVAFTESSFTLHDVRGRLFGGPIAVSGGTRSARLIEVIARGDASFDATRALFDHPLRKHIAGTFGYFVTVRAQDGLARITFESPLRGLQSSLPAPLAKAANDSLPLRLEVNPSSVERDRVSISLGNLARAELQRRRQGAAMLVQRTAVWLNPGEDQAIRLPERPGTLVYGSLSEFDLDRWLPLFSGGGEAQDAIALELRFGSLAAFGRRLSKVSLRASAEAAGWTANVSAEELAGDVAYRTQPQPRLIARLSHFNVPAEVGAAKDGPPARPLDYPAVDLVAEQFTFRGKPLGRVELVASRAGEDWRIERAAMVNPQASLNGSGTWHAAPSRTAVRFDLETGDAGGFLGRVGYPGLVKGGRARMQGALSWHGDPATLDFATLAGEVQMQAEDGQFLEIEPGIGKLISLMSLQALPKRITLDFRDVFSKGFQFDRIAANAQLDSGAMKVREFRMRGSAAEVEMTGEADLARETQNLRVRVVPSLGDSAALGITLVNPVAGVAAAIAQRILKNPLGQIFSYDYAVTGTWTDPKVEKILPPPVPYEQISN